jgi:ADP-heptose:LPS heptosyltransferase
MQLRWPSGEQILYAANVLVNKWFFNQRIGIAPRSILVVKWDEIGDMATATHVFANLKASYPEVELTVLCKPFVQNLIIRDPSIDKIITDIRSFRQRYDLVVELRGTWTTLLKSIIYKAKYRVSRAEVRLRNKGNQLHEIDTNLAIIQPILQKAALNTPRLFFSEEDATSVARFLDNRGIRKFAIIHAGARRKLRQWNLDRFTLAAQYLHEKYGFEIVFAGSAEDRPDIETIRSFLNFPTFDCTEGFSLSQFSYLCFRSSFYLGNESGPLHIASAFEVPLLGLFGPGVPNVFYPRSAGAKILHHVLSCNPCDQIHCVYPGNPCISRIEIADVLEKIDEILHK